MPDHQPRSYLGVLRGQLVVPLALWPVSVARLRLRTEGIAIELISGATRRPANWEFPWLLPWAAIDQALPVRTGRGWPTGVQLLIADGPSPLTFYCLGAAKLLEELAKRGVAVDSVR